MATADLTALLLGPIDLRRGEISVPIGGTKVRAVLAQLVLADGHVVPADQLIDGVWGETPPATATNTLQYHVTVLRKAFAAANALDAVVTRSPGYAITIATDITKFTTAHRAADAAVREHRYSDAAAAYSEALGCWRGPALADLLSYPFAAPRAIALEEQRLNCVESSLDTSLRLGRGEELVPELEQLVAEYPTRERLWEQLMTALYRAGRQADSLAVYERARRILDEELGIEPSPGLREAHAQVLNQDPRLLATARERLAVPLAPTRLRSTMPTREAWLVQADGHRAGIARAPMLLGRDEACHLTFGSDDLVSRQHARIQPTDDGHTIEDLGSTNGTYVNAGRISLSTRLAHGDVIQVGTTVLRYESSET